MKRDHLAYYKLEMQEHFLDMSYFPTPRRVRVLLPESYRNETQAYYPVLYMHDGQNVFYSKESFSGHSWKVIPTIKNNPHFPKIIIVGIDNAGGHITRLNEYSPWITDSAGGTDMAYSGGWGAEYGKWIVKTLKPFIDTHYRTQPERENTLLAGSSMGGLITAYLGAAYPQVFGHLGVFSLASWFSEKSFLDFVNAHPLHRDSNVYIQVGTKEGDEYDKHFIDNINQEYIDCSLRYCHSLLRTGTSLDKMHLRIMANKNHHESHWAHHFVEFLEFALLGKK